MNELEGSVEEAFAVFPETAAFIESGEGAFYDPAFGDDGEGVQFRCVWRFASFPDESDAFWMYGEV